MAALTDIPPVYELALKLIDKAHAEDPRRIQLDKDGKVAKEHNIFTPPGDAAAAAASAAEGSTAADNSNAVPYELHYAQKMTRWLALRCPDASPALQVACRAQHFRRWEMPRDTFPKTRPGYLTWRAKQKSQAAQQVSELLQPLTSWSADNGSDSQQPLAQADIDRIASLIRKENLAADAETQVLEDVACLVFLDDQFDDFESAAGLDEEKMVGLLRKTWGKMSSDGQKLALGMDLSERARELPKTTPSANLTSSSRPRTSSSTTPSTIYKPGNQPPAKPPLDTLINTHDFAHAASVSFSRKGWAFASSAATDCLTHERNTSAYSDIILRPRVLRDVRADMMDLSTTMLGHRISSPVFCAPTSMGRMFHPQGERELGRACRSLGVPQCVSTSCSFPFAEVMDAHEEVEDTAQRVKTPPPVFFQLYMDKDRSKSAALLRDVVAKGARGIFLTVDAPVIGKREADERVQADEMISSPMVASAKAPKTDAKGGGMGRLIGGFIDASMTWDTSVPWIRSVLGPDVPIAIKGVQTAADAVRAMEVGADAVYLSNHGGRSLDTSPATILVLLELQRCCPQVFDKLEVYVDGGIKRGTDIFKALCLGAKAVGIGRGFLYGLNYGQEGIEKYIGILNDELQTTMQMCGITSLDQCHPGLLHTGAVDHLVPQGEEHPYAKWRPKPRL
ncbi:FMN-dependent dehydrogenase-domain-containing protein [Microdochium bolleyi]|uniref:L-lactate dehydrogenase (cytochrome) n=1 Tax=Microdochium bolleyi TaxID=196109 RepID=A0A136J7E7_9PEZI|nr:FMN-dependent dehydrogenase-domain-containing protein [Microdochium bolleyi]